RRPMAELLRHARRRVGTAVGRAGPETRKAERPPEFESHPLRALKSSSYSYSCSYSPIFNERGLDVICEQRSVIAGFAREKTLNEWRPSLSRACVLFAR